MIKTIYVAGPMRGLPYQNFGAFDAARDWLLKEPGWSPISPADLSRDYGYVWDEDGELMQSPDFTIEIAMRQDLAAVCLSEAIALLPGWQKSEGANREITVARWCGLEIYEVTYDAAGEISGLVAIT